MGYQIHQICEFCKISKNTLFTEHLWATASISSANKIHNYLHNIITTNIYTILLEVLYCQHWSPLWSCFSNNGRLPVGKQSLLNTDIFPR